MKYKMLKKAGALQETNLAPQQQTSNNFDIDMLMAEPQSVEAPAQAFAGVPVQGTQRMMRSPARRRESHRGHRETTASSAPGTSLDSTHQPETTSMFFYVVPEGQKVLMTDKQGRGTVLSGPTRVYRGSRKFQRLNHHIAYPGEFLIVKFRDGAQKHLPGPSDLWEDPRIHSGIEKEDGLQLGAKEAIVVYSRASDESDNVSRRIAPGPALFVPEPGEWLHTFSWHGSVSGDYRKVPGALVFQKLWQMPDQMYHDVESVRTADDVVLTVKLMMFFELKDVEKMLDETHDPIGDFINAASSDVLDRVSRFSFDEFKHRTEILNDLESYSQLKERAAQVGYRIHKIVYRGYSTTAALEQMHEQAIETRTRLKLERETEQQAQELADFKQTREFQRGASSREDEQAREKHELDKRKKRHEQELQLEQKKRDAERTQRQLDAAQLLAQKAEADAKRVEYLGGLKELGIDLTAFLTQGRADQVIEVRGSDEVSPHLHLDGDKG